jgi:uncharacterized lipoprotein YddW (UPF0748 family)
MLHLSFSYFIFIILNSYFIGISLLFSQPNQQFYSNPEARALWFTRYQYSNEQSIRETIQKAKQANLNMVLFQVRGQADAYYFSSYEPWAERLGGNYPGFDPLAVAIDEAHRNGIELHAYVNVFPIWSHPYGKPPDSPIHIYNTHPDWIMLNSSGVPMDPSASGYAFGSPGIPEYIDHLFNVFMEVVEKYDIDGLHLDYIRYPSDNYSYDSTSITHFKQETGLSSPYADPFRWAQWRRDQVSNFVYKVYEGVMAKKPWVKVSAAVWGNYYDGFTDKLQDPRIWLKNGKIDFITPMIYERDMGIYQSRLNNHACSSWGRHVYGGIGANALQNYIFTADEILQQIEINRQLMTNGNVIYSATCLNNELIQALVEVPYQIKLSAPEMTWKAVPVIAHVPLKDTEDIINPYPIVATIQSSVPLIPDSLLLLWSLSEDFNNNFVEPLCLLSDSSYGAFIPPHSDRTIYYYLLARNEDGYISRQPQWAPINLFSFHAGPDRIRPVISYQQEIFNSFLPMDTLNFEIKVTDNLALDINSVFVHYSWTDGRLDSIQLIPGRVAEQFVGNIISGAALGDTIYYYFSAHDLSLQKNRAESDHFFIPIGVENFESTVYGWNAGPGWQVSNEQPIKGTYGLKFSPPSDFSANSMSSFQTIKPLNLERLESATLHFWSKYKLDEDLLVGYVDVSVNNGTHWTPIGPALSGYNTQWTEYYFSLLEYCGQGKPEILIRFRAQSILDPCQEQIEWFIDDISLIRDETTVLANDRFQTAPNMIGLYQNYPNPFNSATIIEYEINSSNPILVELIVINLKGQKVKTLSSKKQHQGQYFVTWNGKDEAGLPVPSGVYFYQIHCSEFKAVRKMIVVR